MYNVWLILQNDLYKFYEIVIVVVITFLKIALSVPKAPTFPFVLCGHLTKNFAKQPF